MRRNRRWRSPGILRSLWKYQACRAASSGNGWITASSNWTTRARNLGLRRRLWRRTQDNTSSANGTVWPDRTPKPCLFEFKKLGPAGGNQSRQATGKLVITNKDYFRTLEWLSGSWDCDGGRKIVARGKLPTLKNGCPRSQLVSIKASSHQRRSRTGNLPHVVFIPPRHSRGPAGHEVAWETIEIAEQGEEDRNRSSHGVKVGTGFGRGGQGPLRSSSRDLVLMPQLGLGHARFGCNGRAASFLSRDRAQSLACCDDNDAPAFM